MKTDYITIEGAKVHNLKNITAKIPRNQLTVITGVSGSGKSSLAFDTLYAEGQRRYVESLSAYARQFLGRLEKPDVQAITGLSPAIAIEQKVSTKSSRSTVGTTTEIFEYIKLLFARIGKTYSPISGEEVKRHTVDDVIAYIKSANQDLITVVAPIKLKDRSFLEQLKLYQQQGYARLYHLSDGYQRIDSLIESKVDDEKDFYLAIDRLRLEQGEIDLARTTDSINNAFFEGNGNCGLLLGEDKDIAWFSNRFELDGMSFEEPSEAFFSFNNPYGACGSCEGFGSIIGIDPDLVIPNDKLSLYEDAVVCWKGEKMAEWKDKFIAHASSFDFPIHKPICDLSEDHLDLLWNGAKGVKGIFYFFKYLESKTYKIQYRVMLSRYRGKTKCPDCKGSRIRKDAQYVKIQGTNIVSLLSKPIDELQLFFKGLSLSDHEQKVAARLMQEINDRINFLCKVGLSYLTLDRLSSTLSGGESQRIHLAASLGSSLVGSTYILDEPSIGLHPKDTENLITVLKGLRDLGNTVVVVEHDEELMNHADYLIDIGPMAGSGGGEICFQGARNKIEKSTSLTAKYLNKKLPSPSLSHKPGSFKNFIEIKNAHQHNLKGIDVKFPVNAFSVLVGVSGSGKSTLIRDILYPAAMQKLGLGGAKPGKHDDLLLSERLVNQVEYVDQNPIGKSSRSNPVTYVKAYDEIRALFSSLPQAKSEGLKPAHFSFNVAGGRCDECEGEGEITVEMQFMADIHLPCEYCHGKRFKEDILDIKYREKDIADILDSTIDDAIAFFSEDEKNTAAKRVVKKLIPLQQVGLGYLKLGQSSNTLSGGEAQRIKLASFISKGQSKEKILFLFDEPTTGLHFHDIQNLLHAFDLLLEKGHSILCIEHNTDLIRTAHWMVEIGPGGGKDGGKVLFQGPILELKDCKESVTAGYLGK